MVKPVGCVGIIFMWAMLISSDANAASEYVIGASFEPLGGTRKDFFFPLDCCTLDGDEDLADWFSWTAPADGRLNVAIIFLHAEMDIDLEVLDSSVVVLDSSVGTTDDEEVTIDLPAGSQVFINPYVFEEFGTNDVYVADPYEPNDSAGEAFVIPEAPPSVPVLQQSESVLVLSAAAAAISKRAGRRRPGPYRWQEQ